MILKIYDFFRGFLTYPIDILGPKLVSDPKMPQNIKVASKKTLKKITNFQNHEKIFF